MAYGVKLRVWGELACFTRPEMKVERVSYDVMTPSAARGILEAIYWQHAIVWVVDAIHVLKPVRFTNVRRNEVGSKIAMGTVKAAMNDGRELSLFVEDDRQQRAAMILVDVEYLIEAHFKPSGREDDNPGRHHEVFTRRASKGQCFHQPVFGCREFPAFFELVEGNPPQSPLKGERDLGWMLHDIDYAGGMQPKFFHAVMRDGVMCVPAFEGEGVKA
jgi:CRISPR-associated protein Cas5d